MLATVNGAEITEADLATAREDVGSTLPKQMNDQARDKALLDYLIDVKLVTQKAIADKLDQSRRFPEEARLFPRKAADGGLSRRGRQGRRDPGGDEDDL